MRVIWLFLFVLSTQAFAADQHELKIGSFSKSYPIIPAAADKSVGIIYINDISDNWGMASATAVKLSQSIQASPIFKDLQVVVVPGDGGNMMAGLLVNELKKQKPDLEICIVRGNTKGGVFKSVEYQSITSPNKKKLYLRKDQFDRIQGKKVLVFDDVISSGSTLKAVKSLLDESGCQIQAYACMATEGDDIKKFEGVAVFKAAHLPVFKFG